jgi:DNA-binding GntR family transcriptional regulator
VPSLVERIEQSLRQSLATGDGVDLRLEALAAAHGTSTRPVRLALARLAAAGVLVQDAAGRWRIRRRPAPPRPTRHEVPTTMEPPVDRRLDELLGRRALARDDTFLREDATASQLGISRARLRALFAHAAGRGQVEHVPRRGWRVRRARLEDLDAFLPVRLALESLALTLAFARLDPAQLRTFRAGNEGTRVDNRIHGYVLELAGNRYLSDFFTRQAPFFELLFHWEGHDAGAATRAAHEHRVLLDALLARDLPAAQAALAAHIGGEHPVLRAALGDPVDA